MGELRAETLSARGSMKQSMKRNLKRITKTLDLVDKLMTAWKPPAQAVPPGAFESEAFCFRAAAHLRRI
jgi:hypothetical protein